MFCFTQRSVQRYTRIRQGYGNGLVVAGLLPDALIGKKLTPKQLEKFKAILNDETRWADLIKELS
jgi:hypothetical protein